MKKIFGTDGVRGIANDDLTPELTLKLGKAIGFLLNDRSGKKSTYLIGRDTRISGDMLEAALSAGLASTGADVFLAGVIPTPTVAYLVRTLGLAGGAVISASHNAMEYNGIKFFSSDGLKLTRNVEDQIASIIKSDIFPGQKVLGEKLGRIKILLDTPQYYESYVKSIIPMGLEGFSIAMDCANGASHMMAPGIFSSLGAQVVAFNAHPSGVNINLNCGSTHPEFLRDVMKTGRFDAGLAFDGDADRLIAVDETGELVDGDDMMNILARNLAKEGKLPGEMIVTTVMSNIGLEKALEEVGLKMIRTDVGDRNVLREMISNGVILGGEQSGHIIFLEYSTTGDGIITGLMLLKAMKESGKKLSELRKLMVHYPQVLKNVQVEDKSGIIKYADFPSFLDKMEEKGRGEYRILVRPSGTEPLIRIMVEGPDLEFADKMAKEIYTKVKEISRKVQLHS